MAYDLIVIGGGPAGYVAAIRASQLGKKVACVEADRAGGTCLNWGCIPTKALLKNAEVYHLLTSKAAEFGLKFDNLSYDWSTVIGRSRKVSERLAGGIEFLFKKNKVDYVRGLGSVEGTGKVGVIATDGSRQLLEAKDILIATGCKSRGLPTLPFNGKSVIGSKEAMVLPQQPKEMLIIGAGAIGVEFAYIYNAFGTKVTLVEMAPRILPVEDDEVGDALEKSLIKQGIRCLTNTKITAMKDHGSHVELTVEGPKENGVLSAEVCIVAIGIQPNGEVEVAQGDVPAATDLAAGHRHRQVAVRRFVRPRRAGAQQHRQQHRQRQGQRQGPALPPPQPGRAGKPARGRTAWIRHGRALIWSASV